MKNKTNIGKIIRTSAVAVLLLLVRLISAGSSPAVRGNRTNDTEKGTPDPEDAQKTAKIVAGSRFCADRHGLISLGSNGEVYLYNGEEEELCRDEEIVGLIRKGYEGHMEFEDLYWYEMLVDCGRYEQARAYAYTPDMQARLEALGAEPERRPAEQFTELPAEKQAAIEEAWSIVSRNPLYADAATKTFQPWLTYMGTYGDDCQIIRSFWYMLPENRRQTCDSWEGYIVAGIVLPYDAVSFYVYRNNEWMGLNMAYKLGYMSLQDLKELAVSLELPQPNIPRDQTTRVSKDPLAQ